MTQDLFWYGCNMTRHAEIIRLSERLMGALGAPAQPVGGPATCCGSVKESTPRIAEGMANRTMDRFNDSGAARVITWCPSCHSNLDDFMGAARTQRFDHLHLAQAVLERADALAPLMTRRFKARVLIDRHIGNRTGVNEAVPALLRMVPGVTVLEDDYRAPSYMCFGLANVPGALPAHKDRLLAVAEAAGADTIVTIFHSCHRELVGLERTHGIRVLNWVHVLAEGLGWDYADDYKAWRNSDDPAVAIGEDRMAAAGEDAVRKLAVPELARPR